MYAFRITFYLLLTLLIFGCSITRYPKSLTHISPGISTVQSSHPVAISVGNKILNANGNAFDAAIAMILTLNVVEPYASGLGGGGFALTYTDKTSRYEFLDARETAPSGIGDQDLSESNSTVGATSVGIPGVPALLENLAKRATLSKDILCNPAINLAKNGFKPKKLLLKGLEFKKDILIKDITLRRIFFKESNAGEVVKNSEKIIQSELAKTMKDLCNRSFMSFYSKDNANKYVKFLNHGGAKWKVSDLLNYKIVIRDPLVFRSDNLNVFTAPLPSAGGLALYHTLSEFNNFDTNKLSKINQIHLLSENFRRAYIDRILNYEDKLPTYTGLNLTLHNRFPYTFKIKENIATSSSDIYSKNLSHPQSHHTTHINIVDKWGNIVSATLSLNHWYGSGITLSNTGIILNNQLDDFSIRDKKTNSYGIPTTGVNNPKPGYRMISSMMPTIARDKDGTLVIGAAGGTRIISSIIQTIFNWHFNKVRVPKDLVIEPRFHHQAFPDEILYEEGAINSIEQAKLRRKGHKLKKSNRRIATLEVSAWDYNNESSLKSFGDPYVKGKDRIY